MLHGITYCAQPASSSTLSLNGWKQVLHQTGSKAQTDSPIPLNRKNRRLPPPTQRVSQWQSISHPYQIKKDIPDALFLEVTGEAHNGWATKYSPSSRRDTPQKSTALQLKLIEFSIRAHIYPFI